MEQRAQEALQQTQLQTNEKFLSLMELRFSQGLAVATDVYGQRQAVAIGRATAFNAKVVIMDEPTASLSVAAIEQVLELISQLKEHKVAVIIISHRLEDILSVSDRVMVLRLGRRVGYMENEGITKDDLVAYMVGARDDFAEN